MKINNKGFTLVELVLGFALLAIIVMGMLSISLNYRYSVKTSNRRIGLTQYKNSITRLIQDDILEKGILDINYCNDDVLTCVTFTFRDSTTKNLSFSNNNQALNNRYIQYGNRKFPVEEPDLDELLSISDATIHLPSERTGIILRRINVDDSIVFKVYLGIGTDDIDEDFGINIVTTNNERISPVTK